MSRVGFSNFIWLFEDDVHLQALSWNEKKEAFREYFERQGFRDPPARDLCRAFIKPLRQQLRADVALSEKEKLGFADNFMNDERYLNRQGIALPTDEEVYIYNCSWEVQEEIMDPGVMTRVQVEFQILYDERSSLFHLIVRVDIGNGYRAIFGGAYTTENRDRFTRTFFDRTEALFRDKRRNFFQEIVARREELVKAKRKRARSP
jgi:hypothetical protein